MAVLSTEFEETLLRLGVSDTWEQRNGAWWASPTVMNLRAAVQRLLACGARFITMTASEQPGCAFRVDYHWDFDSNLVTLTFSLPDRILESITDICPAADWVEREMHEYFAVEFPGRVDTAPLMIRAGQPLGILLHKDGGA